MHAQIPTNTALLMDLAKISTSVDANMIPMVPYITLALPILSAATPPTTHATGRMYCASMVTMAPAAAVIPRFAVAYGVK